MLYRLLAVVFLLPITLLADLPERVNFRVSNGDFEQGKNWTLKKYGGQNAVWYRVNRSGEGTVVTIQNGEFCVGRTQPCVPVDPGTDSWLGNFYPSNINHFQGRRRELVQSVIDRRAAQALAQAVQQPPAQPATPTVPTPTGGGQGGISQPTHFQDGQPVPPPGSAGSQHASGPSVRPVASKFDNWKGQFNQWGPAQVSALSSLLQANTFKNGETEDPQVGVLDKNWKCVNPENEEIPVKLFLVRKPNDEEGKARIALHLTKLEKEISADELAQIKATRALTLSPREASKWETQGALWGVKTNPEDDLGTHLKEYHLKVKATTDGSPAEYVLKYVASGFTFFCKKVQPITEPPVNPPGPVSTPHAQPPLVVPPGNTTGNPQKGGSYD